ncbi:ABC transporter transmembrane domain-containing protein, partial [Arthrospira platensis SPKY1]|nr:ABC transporter transmembrane domain-containing protein [Arthrospira platensis SPKY1]
MAKPTAERPRAQTPQSLTGLWPFLSPYRWQLALALLFLLLAAATTLAFPVALRWLIDEGLTPSDTSAALLALQGYFVVLFGVALALGIFSSARFYLMSWIGERVTADVRNAVY